MQGDNDKDKAHASSHDEDNQQQPIHGGGLEEWKRQNAKIINNGMIMAEEDARHGCEALDKSRASTVEPGLAPDGSLKTPRMFTAINRHTEGQPSPMQAYQPLPGGDGDLPTHPGPGAHGDLDIMENLNEWESSRIADCLGGVGGDIQGFSYGDVPETNLLFEQVVPMIGFGGT